MADAFLAFDAPSFGEVCGAGVVGMFAAPASSVGRAGCAARCKDFVPARRPFGQARDASGAARCPCDRRWYPCTARVLACTLRVVCTVALDQFQGVDDLQTLGFDESPERIDAEALQLDEFVLWHRRRGIQLVDRRQGVMRYAFPIPRHASYARYSQFRMSSVDPPRNCIRRASRK